MTTWPLGFGPQTQIAHLKVLLNEVWNVHPSQCAMVLVISFVWGKAPCGAVVQYLTPWRSQQTLFEKKMNMEKAIISFLPLFEEEKLR